MFRVLGSKKQLCDGVTRRDMLQAGGLSMFGLGLSSLLESEQAQASVVSGSFGTAKRCIILYLYGAPSQLETFDMKPAAPVEIRGTMKPISSSLPGLDVCEHLPETAQIMDKVTVLRSLTHQYPIHGIANAMTGVPIIDVGMELSPNDPRHYPYIGSAIEYYDRKSRGGKLDPFPQNVALPFPLSTQRVGEVRRAGPYASFLGSAFNPIWTEYDGTGTTSVYKTLGDKKIDCFDPYVGCSDDSHFRLSTTSKLPQLTTDRLNRRKTLLQQFDASRKDLENSDMGRSLSTFQEMAYSLISSNKVSNALDVRKEAAETRDLYGKTLFGQACLAGRRMLEAGTRLVSVFWDEYGLAGDAWDTHWNHYDRMQNQLLPGFDKGYAGLIRDLEQRGMLDDTLVVCISEHGRTPKLSTGRGGGRGHWSRAYSALFAGGGITRGNVVGSTDDQAGEVTSRPADPKDAQATIYHLLGIDPHSTLYNPRDNRTVNLVPDETRVIEEMLA